ncbi:MAG: hypothetical protein AAFY74_20355 [Pseudomonadota bacterium]
MAALPQNATLTFQTATGTGTDGFGNPVATTVSVELPAYLTADRRSRPSDMLMPGADLSVQILRGNILDKTTLPAGVGHLSKGRAVINGQAGDFELILPVQSPFAAVTAVLGVRIQGRFSPD